jgi:uncharacterized protein
MKPSRYNFIFEENGNVYIYNAFVNSFAKINSEIVSFISSLEKGDRETQISEEVISPLIRGGFIVEDSKDELAELKVRNRIGRFTSTSFGVTIAPTLACNFKCTYCFEQPSSEKMSRKTIDAVYDFVLRNLKNKTSFGVCWYGGEPLLALDTVEYLSKRFIALCRTMDILYDADIISNGFLMNEKTANLLANDLKVNFWQVTIDGPLSIHNKRRPTITGGSSFETVLNNLINCYEYFDRVSVRINVDKSNKEDVPELLDILDETGLKNKVSIYFGKIQPFGAACKSIRSICFTEEEFSKTESRLYEVALQKGFILSRHNQLLTNYCGADRINSFVIEPNGNMSKCWNCVGIKEESVGSVYDDVLNDNYIRWLSYDPFQDPECVDCNLLPICMGGCPYDAIIGSKKVCSAIKYNLIERLKLRNRELVLICQNKESTESEQKKDSETQVCDGNPGRRDCFAYSGDFMEYIARTLKSKFSIVPDFIKHPKWFWKVRKVETPCMNCGSNNDVWCLRASHTIYYEMHDDREPCRRFCLRYLTEYSADFNKDTNEYYHICLDCGNITHKTEAPGQRTCSNHRGTIRPKCPFCGQDW